MKHTKTFAFYLGCLFFNPTLNLNPSCHSRHWKHHVWFWPILRPQRHQVNSFHTFNKSSWSYKMQKIRLCYWLPCVAGCLLPNLRPLKGQHNERRGFRGQLTNVKPPDHMKGEQANPRRPPLSSLTADLSKLGRSPPPWLVWNVDYVLGEGRGTGVKLHGRPLPAEKVEISCRKHLMLSGPAANAPSDTADKWFSIWKHAVGVWKLVQP